MTDCVFCRIVAGEIPATVVHRDERVLAFRDLNPQAPSHVLVIPLEHYPDAAAVAAADPTLLSDLVLAAREVADNEEIIASGYRMVFNTGAGAGQSVFHCHLHLLGGRPLDWPPG